jgi:putative oxidoreductase
MNRDSQLGYHLIDRGGSTGESDRRPLGRRPARNAEARMARLIRLLPLHLAAPTLRLALAAIFVWFGVLKIAGRSPVAELLGATFPWADPHLLLLVLGGVEVALGLVLVLRRYTIFVLPIVAAHLGGTFITFLLAPGRMFEHGNPLLLTADGEFVMKNLVIISAVLVLLATTDRSRA